MNMMINAMKKIYSKLGDEQSRDIFLNRVLYSITEDNTYIDNIVSVYYKRMQREFCGGGYTDAISNLRQQIGNRKVVIYGKGNCGFVTLALFTSAMKYIDVVAFCDRNTSGGQFYGYKLVDIDELARNYKDTVILVTPVEERVKDEIISNLVKKGFNLDQIIEKVPFRDYVLRGEYFDEVMQFGEDEVFVDAGCFNCGTAIDFVERHSSYKKIISFEPDLEQYNLCLQISQTQEIRNHTIYNMGLWDKKDELFFMQAGSSGCLSQEGNIRVKVDALDHILQGEKVTFIKMDIEGAELRALHGCRNTIVEHRPKLAICVYHKPEDIIEIPFYIHEIAPEYKFYLRHHSKGRSETVLYAVP